MQRSQSVVAAEASAGLPGLHKVVSVSSHSVCMAMSVKKLEILIIELRAQMYFTEILVFTVVPYKYDQDNQNSSSVF